MTVFFLPFLSRLSRLILSGAAALILIGSVSQLHAQSVVVMVNGEPITNFDIEQRTKLTELSIHKVPTRQEVIDDLINEKVKTREAKKYGVAPSDSEIEAAYGTMASRMRLNG